MKKEYYLYLLLSSTILGIPAAYAACVPTPDCAELGYTETECPEGGVKCPWDTTKFFCGPSCNLTTTKADCDANCLNVGTQSCSKNGVTYYSGCGVSKCTSGQSCVNGTCTCDSVYKYTCSGTGYAGGVGTTCGGKYQSCTCASGYTWGGGACCSNSYKYTCTSGSYVTGGSGSACNGKYTACSCSSPRTWSNGSCICSSSYKYTCSGTGYSGGSGTACNGKYTSCNCSSGYSWNGSSCQYCGSSYKYTCSGTGYSGGSGSYCGGLYSACNCSSGYTWNGSSCQYCGSSYKYTCSGGGYSGGSGSACGGLYTACNCSSGYSWNGSSCQYCGSSYKYTCSGTGYSGGSGSACNGKYTSCNCAGGYSWSNGVCSKTCAVGDILNSDYTCSTSKVSGKTPIGVVAFISGNTRLAIDIDNGYKSWGSNIDIPTLNNYTANYSAIKDWDGDGNTSKMTGYGGVAARYCRNKAGFLPAAGQLYSSIGTNGTLINNGIAAAGGTQLTSKTTCWSSTEHSAGVAWAVGLGGVWSSAQKSALMEVRCMRSF